MPGFPQTITRRRLLTHAGLAATLVMRPARLLGQGRAETAPDGFRILRAGLVPASGRQAANPAPLATWGYDGATPGPVLRVKRGAEVRVRLINGLAGETSLHWHGVRLPNAMDGVPHLTQAPVAPGASFDYRFTPPDAGTFWYRAPASEQLDRGLLGALIVEEPEPVEVDRDVLLVLADARPSPLDSTPEPGSPPVADTGRAGGSEHLTVNGQPSLEIPVKANERLRLRFVNAARARVLALRLEAHRTTVMAIDGQPAEPFVARDSRVVLGPGNRLDLFADMTLAPGANAPVLLATASGERPIARFVYAAGAPARPAPLGEATRALPANPLPARIDFRSPLRLDLPIDRGARNWTPAKVAAAGPYGPPLFSVKRGRTVMLALVNRTEIAAAIHLHGHHARLLDNLDDGWKPFWLDTVMVAAAQTARLAFVADNPGKWLVHAQPLIEADAGMAAWFEVT